MPTAPVPYCSTPGCPNRKPCPAHPKPLSSQGIRLRGSRAVKRKVIKLRRSPICENCGQSIAAEIDHITPLHKGGLEAWTNLQALCHDCHQRKTRTERA